MQTDLLLVGGGLANGLIAYRLSQTRPDLQVRILEAESGLGGNHLWSFHETDLSADQARWIAPFVSHEWAGQDLVFPGFTRRLGTGYRSIASSRFAETLGRTLRPDAILTGRSVLALEPNRAVLQDGSTMEAGAVVDGRGRPGGKALVLGFQKFVGLEVRLESPHGLTVPTIMDATVVQHDGFRFVYVLPLAADRLLIEDTYYSDAPQLEAAAIRERIAQYAGDRGWRIAEVEREEGGTLPIALAGDIDAMLGTAPGIALSGLSAGLFHPVTGYSLPDAVRLADLIAALPDLGGPALSRAVADHVRATWNSRAYLRFLARMLFRAATPDQRWRVLARFYRLSQGLIERFYAGRSTPLDKARILIGKPPVPVTKAVGLISEGRFLTMAQEKAR